MKNPLHNEKSKAKTNRIFDRERILHNKNRASSCFSNHDFLHRHAAKMLRDRLYDIKKDFPCAIELGSSVPVMCQNIMQDKGIKQAIYTHHSQAMLQKIDCSAHAKKILFDEENLSIETEPSPLVVSNLALHTVNKLPELLDTIRKDLLQPDGAFLASFIGGTTLHEFKDIMMRVETEMYGGVAARIAPMLDMKTLGMLIQNAGFQLPVIDFETVTVSYKNLFDLMHDLRGMGENRVHGCAAPYNVSKRFFHEVERQYRQEHSDPEGCLVARFDIIYVMAWSPGPGQPKPLKRGSGQISLHDALGKK